jgi:hypothetical protein
MVALVSLILGYFFGAKSNVAQVRTAREIDKVIKTIGGKL